MLVMIPCLGIIIKASSTITAVSELDFEVIGTAQSGRVCNGQSLVPSYFFPHFAYPRTAPQPTFPSCSYPGNLLDQDEEIDNLTAELRETFTSRNVETFAKKLYPSAKNRKDVRRKTRDTSCLPGVFLST